MDGDVSATDLGDDSLKDLGDAGSGDLEKRCFEVPMVAGRLEGAVLLRCTPPAPNVEVGRELGAGDPGTEGPAEDVLEAAEALRRSPPNLLTSAAAGAMLNAKGVV